MTIPEQRQSKIRVIGINGSLRRASYTRMALHLALQGAQEVGAEVGLLDLRDYEIVFCDGETKGDALPLGVHWLRREIKEAQGIILGTPEYHGSFSGVLKNALDLMGFEEFEGDEETQLAWREKLLKAGCRVSPVMDRVYFKSIYTNDPDGYIVELATVGPGFTVDEEPAHLGQSLKLPPWLEPRRTEIEGALAPLTVPAWQLEVV